MLRWPTIAARVVDLPEPVAPTMITRPRGIMAMSFRPGGRCRSSTLGMVVMMCRKTTPQRPCCTNALTRKRPISGWNRAKLASWCFSYSANCRSVISALANRAVSVGVRLCLAMGETLPLSLSAGGNPAVRNRSEAFWLTM